MSNVNTNLNADANADANANANDNANANANVNQSLFLFCTQHWGGTATVFFTTKCRAKNIGGGTPPTRTTAA